MTQYKSLTVGLASMNNSNNDNKQMHSYIYSIEGDIGLQYKN